MCTTTRPARWSAPPALPRPEPRTGAAGEFAYSDVNYLVLGALVEQVSGQPFATALHDRVLAPLELNDTTAAAAHGLAPGHRRWWGAQVAFDAPYDTSGAPYGYVTSTPADLTRWAQAQQAGTHLSAESLRQLTSEQIATAPDDRGRPSWYGFGWRGGDLGGHPFVEHTGANPGSFAHVLWLPADGVRVTVLANSYSHASQTVFAEQARKLARQAVGAETVTAASDPVFTFAPWVVAAIALLGGLLLIQRLARGRRRRPIAAVVAGLVAVLFAAAPYLLGFDHRLLRLWMPDLGWSLLAGAGVFAALGVALLVRRRHNDAMPSTDADPSLTTRLDEVVR